MKTSIENNMNCTPNVIVNETQKQPEVFKKEFIVTDRTEEKSVKVEQPKT